MSTVEVSRTDNRSRRRIRCGMGRSLRRGEGDGLPGRSRKPLRGRRTVAHGTGRGSCLRVLTLATIHRNDRSPSTSRRLADIPVSWLDVDHRAAVGLLTDVAQSVDGVLWAASHPVLGPCIRFEDPANVSRSISWKAGRDDRRRRDRYVRMGDLAARHLRLWRPPRSGDVDDSVSDVATCVVAPGRNRSSMTTAIRGPWNTTSNRSTRLPRKRRYGTCAESLKTILTTDDDGDCVVDQLIVRLGASW